jgi:hypothetical protein
MTLATPTLARIYARQGLTERARQIYHALLQQTPGDPEIESALAELDGEQPAATEKPTARQDATSRVLLSAERDRVVCRWSAAPSALEAARLLLGTRGELTLRWALFFGEEVACEDTPLRDTAGQLVFDVAARTLLVSAAIGLRNEAQQFVAIAHAERLNLSERAGPPQQTELTK